ncbi:ATPase family AAA domain-containing protein 5-like isoform X2 [Acanthaster planci]|uniref:ATPase family AAA domain-containing protein 5-like isoform X2 n=1 Tax=Acanthaster planci TaxID=133434 RepID=A0A8B7YK26_ACAPL|nr:ATPase family AAA domain-containing protein 5-like isoform X2 [Acanthaster planci]
MIGIMNTQSPKATDGQNMDEDDLSLKLPSSFASKNSSLITSFFKPKTPKQSTESPLDNLIRGDDGGCPKTSQRDIPSDDPSCSEIKNTSEVNASSYCQRSKVHPEEKKHDGGLHEPCINAAKQASSCKAIVQQDKLKSGHTCKSNDSKSRLKQECNKPLKAAQIQGVDCFGTKSENNATGDPSRSTSKASGCGKFSKKRKKNADQDSSSDDFEFDKRTKMAKKELPEVDTKKRIVLDEAPESKVMESGEQDSDAASTCSDDDIFEVVELPGHPKVISYQDFLNESRGENQDEETDLAGQSENRMKNSSGKPFQNDAEVAAKDKKLNPKKSAQAEKKTSQTVKKPKKSNPTTKTEDVSTETVLSAMQEKARGQKGRRGEQKSDNCLPDDDSVLTISYSDFLEAKSVDQSEKKPSPLPLTNLKQKVVTIEAEVHSPPCSKPPNSVISPITVDLCQSPENQQTPVTKKRTSNVVVNVSDLDLMIISTDDASAAFDNRKTKTLYSIFQKKGTTEKLKQTECKALKEEEPTEKFKDAHKVSDVKPKCGRPRKQLKSLDLNSEIKAKTSTREADGSLKVHPKTQNSRRAKKTLKNIFDSQWAENTEEEFEEDITKKGKEATNRKRGKAKRFGSSSGDREESRGCKKTSQLVDVVVMTSTPKAKIIKNVKAQQLLRRAKSRQMNKASSLPSHTKDSKRNAQGAKGASETNCRLDLSTSQRPKPGSTDQARKPRDLTNVLGRRISPKEVANDGIKKEKMKKGVASRKAVMEEVQERKATKLAPMFTKEGRLALAKKQQSLDGQTSHTSPVVILDEDETSRDSVRSDGGAIMGGTFKHTYMSDTFVRSRDSEAERSYPPFPTVSHVLQMVPEVEGSADWWKLPSPCSYGKFLIAEGKRTSFFDKNLKTVDRLMRLGEFTRCFQGGEITLLFKNFTGHPELSHDTQRLILDQIKSANPRFPVNRVFKRYLAKRKGEPLVPKPAQALEAKSSPNANSSFTKLKEQKPAGKRKSEVTERQGNTKRRKLTQEGSAENQEAESVGKSRLRRRSSRQVIKDDEDEETEDAREQPKLRRSSRHLEQASKKEGGVTDPKEGRTQRMKPAAKAEAEKDGKKEGLKAEAAKIVETKAEKLASLPWTEKYQPVSSAEVIGNAQAMRRLTGWLTEWKKKTARIKKKMKRQQGQHQNKTLSALPLEESDSDFDLGSESDNSDSEDDDDSLSNAMLIIGPCGCGKTAAVYACAKELGFKVFEVNASSKRTGKQILADLGEATQSHHLSAHDHGNSSGALKSFFPAKSPPKSSTKPEAKKMPIPKAFAAFYKAGANAAAAKPGRKKVKAPPKKNTPKSEVHQVKSRTLSTSRLQQSSAVVSGGHKDSTAVQRLTSTSLILFEDVDVVFEEDKGFLSAIATFLKTTKRPIVLTTSDSSFPDMFEERYEMVTFRKPPSLTTHLQLLCLAENVCASHADLHRLVLLLNSDVRRCWLAGQFWVNSGAAQESRTGELGILNQAKLESKAPGDRQNMERSAAVLGRRCGEVESGDCLAENDGHAQLRMHNNCFESTLGLCNLSEDRSGVSSVLMGQGRDGPCLHTRSTITERFQEENDTSVYFRNIHTLLPPVSLRDNGCANQESSIDQSQSELRAQSTNGRTARLTHRLVTSLAAFADDISFFDAHTLSPRHDGKGRGDSGWWGAKVKPTLSLDPTESDVNYVMEDSRLSIRGLLEAASFSRCHSNYDRSVNQINQLLRDDVIHGSVQEQKTTVIENPAEIEPRLGQDCLKLHQDDCTKCPELYSTLVNKLPLSMRCNHRVLATEYLPTLRCICRSEQIREEMKIKRRFLHYLDSISLNLKTTDHISLCSIMEMKQPTREDNKSNENCDVACES